MRPVRGAKGIVHIDLGQRGEVGGEDLVSLLLCLVEAEVFEEADAAFGQVADDLLGAIADALFGEDDFGVEELGEVDRDGLERELGVVALGPSKVASEDDAGPLLTQVVDGGEGRGDAGVIGDDAILHRDVEVDPDEDDAAVDINLLERANA